MSTEECELLYCSSLVFLCVSESQLTIVSCDLFIDQTSYSDTVTHDPIGGPKVIRSIFYRVLLTMGSE
jgi:hypothetical protein